MSRATRPHSGSLNDRLSTLAAVGDYLYLEIAGHEDVQPMQARILAASRYPTSMQGWRFTVGAYTAVRATLGDVRMLVRVERAA